MTTKDLFSGHASVYANFRPTYPAALFDYLDQFVPKKNRAWDCATGNGQIAQHLASRYEEVVATDISEKQLANAFQANNIRYQMCPAEKTSFPSQYVNLITVGQALHWFDRDAFFAEAKRVLAPDGIIAVIGYSFLHISPSVDKLILNFYSEVVGPYWDDARKLVEEKYASINFPFEEISVPPFSIETKWNLHQLLGYLESWSATQKFIQARQYNPIKDIEHELKKIWPADQIQDVTFPLFVKMGRISTYGT